MDMKGIRSLKDVCQCGSVQYTASGHRTGAFMPHLVRSISNVIQGAQSDKVSMMGKLGGHCLVWILLNI